VLALTAHPEGLDLAIVGGRIGPIPLPRWLLPHSLATERCDTQGRFCFDVPIVLPFVGRLVHYRGWLEPVEPRMPASPAVAAVARG
jgi:hypothetical protein